MTPEELAEEVRQFITDCQERVTGVGAQQYWNPGEKQRFETMPFDGLLEYAEEEFRDVAVYATMIAIRIRRLRTAFQERDLRENDDATSRDHHHARHNLSNLCGCKDGQGGD